MIDSESLLRIYEKETVTQQLQKALSRQQARVKMQADVGSFSVVIAASLIKKQPQRSHLFLLPDKESAAYFFNDLESLLKQEEEQLLALFFFPNTQRKPYESDRMEQSNMFLRTEVIRHLATQQPGVVVSYPEAICEKTIADHDLKKETLSLVRGEGLSIDFLVNFFEEYGFDRVDFVVEPGQYSLRGGIVDIFSFANENPYRVEFFGENIESIRTFSPGTQLSLATQEEAVIIPNMQKMESLEHVHVLTYFDQALTTIWAKDFAFLHDRIAAFFSEAEHIFQTEEGVSGSSSPQEIYLNKEEFRQMIAQFSIVEYGLQTTEMNDVQEIHLALEPQPSFNKNFAFLVDNLNQYTEKGYANFFCVADPKQMQRVEKVLKEFASDEKPILVYFVQKPLEAGFIDHDSKVVCYTDHQIFERYHKYKIKNQGEMQGALALKDIFELKPGDFITHIDHGVGVFGGLEKIETNGRQQEAIRLLYKDNDILYVSIHALHKISKYVGKEGTSPKLNRLGTSTWSNLKSKTKQRVKDIAQSLIRLYAERKSAKGFAFSPDTYLQHELEASFIYEDTPDQHKATQDVKRDMENFNPMDRLICGDVGFGKTEVAIRAAFKAVADSKQVAVLVPTTILAMQHHRTFSERLKRMPCRVEHIHRFRSNKEKMQIKKDLQEGKIDILIGTHRLISKDVEFKDLGLLIVDEEQKFGVGVKEKLKQMKVNVDTLALSATPIPRTLQFSLMGARDLSIITTPPPNRYPVQTELHVFDEEVIKEAIEFEVSRGGQVYFVHNRVQNIFEIAEMVRRLVPKVRVGVGHGQMEGAALEKVMIDFIEGEYDVLVATTIIENGLDIPNANTIIINDAQNNGLSDLHQLRGRVGRSNKKAFCYLFTPPMSTLTSVAQKRLQSIEEYSDIGSGFNIAMRDLDIRGAGNILGAEQSGFIAEIGFDMYHKILNEAIQELKTGEFSDIYTDDHSGDIEFLISDCVVETDLKLLIPDSYVSSIPERLNLYKELDNMTTDEDTESFMQRLLDRFGKLPQETEDLIQVIPIRQLAKKMGFEKLVIKQQRMIGYFIADQTSRFYQSSLFSKIIAYLPHSPYKCQMKERKEKLSIGFQGVENISRAHEILKQMAAFIFEAEGEDKQV